MTCRSCNCELHNKFKLQFLVFKFLRLPEDLLRIFKPGVSLAITLVRIFVSLVDHRTFMRSARNHLSSKKNSIANMPLNEGYRTYIVCAYYSVLRFFSKMWTSQRDRSMFERKVILEKDSGVRSFLVGMRRERQCPLTKAIRHTRW